MFIIYTFILTTINYLILIIETIIVTLKKIKIPSIKTAVISYNF